MNRLKFRFKVIKILNKIQISIPFRARMRLSAWITSGAAIFVKFDPIRKMELPKIIEFESKEERDEFFEGR